jgi:hypothetical protein
LTNPGIEFLANFFGPRWLGHGRATECYFSSVAALYAIFLVAFPHAAQDSQATRELTGPLLALPFFVTAFCGFAGLIANIRGWRFSRLLRFCSGLFGSMIFFWYIRQFFDFGIPAAFGVPFAIVALPFSLRIMVMALADRPVPGAPGQR